MTSFCLFCPDPDSVRMREMAYIYGAGEVTRTPDLLITNQLLYQLSYSGIARACERASIAEAAEI